MSLYSVLSRAQKPTAVATITATAEPSISINAMQDQIVDGKGAVHTVYTYAMCMYIDCYMYVHACEFLTSKQGSAKQRT